MNHKKPDISVIMCVNKNINNGEKFIYLDDVIFEKDSKSSFILDKLVDKSRFSSPEFLNVKSLPFRLHSNSKR